MSAAHEERERFDMRREGRTDVVVEPEARKVDGAQAVHDLEHLCAVCGVLEREQASREDTVLDEGLVGHLRVLGL